MNKNFRPASLAYALIVGAVTIAAFTLTGFNALSFLGAVLLGTSATIFSILARRPGMRRHGGVDDLEKFFEKSSA